MATRIIESRHERHSITRELRLVIDLTVEGAQEYDKRFADRVSENVRQVFKDWGGGVVVKKCHLTLKED